MRGLKSRVGRVVVAVSVMVALAAPLQAMPKGDRDGWVPKIVKVLKKLGIGTTGDMITVPRP